MEISWIIAGGAGGLIVGLAYLMTQISIRRPKKRKFY